MLILASQAGVVITLAGHQTLLLLLLAREWEGGGYGEPAGEEGVLAERLFPATL